MSQYWDDDERSLRYTLVPTSPFPRSVCDVMREYFQKERASLYINNKDQETDNWRGFEYDFDYYTTFNYPTDSFNSSYENDSEDNTEYCDLGDLGNSDEDITVPDTSADVNSVIDAQVYKKFDYM